MPDMAGSIITRALDLALGQILEYVMEGTCAERGCLVFLDDYYIYRGNEKLKRVFPFSSSVVAQLLEDGIGLVSFEADSVEASASVQLYGLRSAVATPVEDPEEGLMGILYCDNQVSRDAFTARDLSLLQSVARVIAPALHLHTRLRLQG